MRSKRILGVVLGLIFCLVAGGGYGEPADPGRLADADYAVKGDDFEPEFGNWFDPDNVGWGLDIQRVGDLLFVIWFTYRTNGTPIWYVIVGELDGMSWSGDIDVFKWDFFGSPGSQADAATVGTMTIVWSDETNAAVSWTLDGTPGGADVSFAEFAGGPTLANMTGHYFPFFAPGWGFTLLTQGEVTVITLYFYKNGQPVWLQGVVTEPGFVGFAGMNYFFAPDLCPSCLAKQGGEKAAFDVSLAAELRYEYTPGNPQDATLFVEKEVVPSPLGLGPPFVDIPLGFVPTAGSSITGVYMNNYLAGLEQPEVMPVVCIPFQYRSNLMSSNPMPTGSLDTHYVTTERSPNGNQQVFLDANCLNPHLWMAEHDGQMYSSWIQVAPTGMIAANEFATQQKWFIMVPNAFSFGQETCDLEEGIGVYGTKRLQLDGGTVSGLELYGTGVINYNTQICTDMYHFNEVLFRQNPLPENQEFLDERFGQFMVRVDYEFD